jgi:hypothetical protein
MEKLFEFLEKRYKQERENEKEDEAGRKSPESKKPKTDDEL